MVASNLTPTAPGSAVTYGTGRFGSGLTGAASSTVQLAVGGNFGITAAPWTFEAWAKTTNTGTQVLLGLNGANWIGSTSSHLSVNFGGIAFTGTINIADGNWHHLAVTLDPSAVLRLFVDGTLDTSSTSTFANGVPWPASGDGSVGIGYHFGSTSFGWVGTLDEVRISNTARYTGAFTAPSAAFTTDSSTAALWHLDGDGVDVSGNGNLATTSLGPTFGAGKFSSAVYSRFGGYTTTQSFGSAYPLTIEFWVKATGNQGTRVAVGNNGITGSASWVGTKGTTAHCELFGTNFSSNASITDGVWHHIAYTYDGTIIKQWVDGTLDGTANTTSTTTPWGTGTLGFGQYGTDTTFNWYGGLDEVRISNTVRYTTTFTRPASAFIWDANTTGLFHFNGNGTATNTVDAAGGLKVWNGTAWAIKPVKVWTGTAWVTKPVKRWTGSAWVTLP